MKNLKQIFLEYGFNLTENQERQFDAYYSHLVEKNKVMNLTAITEQQDVIFKHFLDSCLPADLFFKNASIVDVGSGAGFPAIPLKILRPDLNVFMVDSLQKRVNFLTEVTEKLTLNGIQAFHSRAEDFAKANREKFDFAVARAVAPLNTLVEYLLPLTKVGGMCIIYKSNKLDEELEKAKNAIKILGAKVLEIKNFYMKQIDATRNILVLKKMEKTPAKYPRSKNLPKQNPL